MSTSRQRHQIAGEGNLSPLFCARRPPQPGCCMPREEEVAGQHDETRNRVPTAYCSAGAPDSHLATNGRDRSDHRGQPRPDAGLVRLIQPPCLPLVMSSSRSWQGHGSFRRPKETADEAMLADDSALVTGRFTRGSPHRHVGRLTLSRRCPGRGLTPAQTPFPLGAPKTSTRALSTY